MLWERSKQSLNSAPNDGETPEPLRQRAIERERKRLSVSEWRSPDRVNKKYFKLPLSNQKTYKSNAIPEVNRDKKQARKKQQLPTKRWATTKLPDDYHSEAQLAQTETEKAAIKTLTPKRKKKQLHKIIAFARPYGLVFLLLSFVIAQYSGMCSVQRA